MTDILGRNIVDGKTAWLLKELGYKGWVSGYYHENEYEEVEGVDALEYFDYECIGNRSGFVNENSVYRAAAPTLVEALQFLIDKKYNIIINNHDEAVVVVYVSGSDKPINNFCGETLDDAIDAFFKFFVYENEQ